jgi:hypothetical protein
VPERVGDPFLPVRGKQNPGFPQGSLEASLEGSNPLLAIATAYGDYTKKSFEDTKLFVEKLCGVKSFDKAIEVQTEFAKTACETFATESERIGVLYGDLAKQSYKPFGGFAEK